MNFYCAHCYRGGGSRPQAATTLLNGTALCMYHAKVEFKRLAEEAGDSEVTP